MNIEVGKKYASKSMSMWCVVDYITNDGNITYTTTFMSDNTVYSLCDTLYNFKELYPIQITELMEELL